MLRARHRHGGNSNNERCSAGLDRPNSPGLFPVQTSARGRPKTAKRSARCRNVSVWARRRARKFSISHFGAGFPNARGSMRPYALTNVCFHEPACVCTLCSPRIPIGNPRIFPTLSLFPHPLLFLGYILSPPVHISPVPASPWQKQICITFDGWRKG